MGRFIFIGLLLLIWPTFVPMCKVIHVVQGRCTGEAVKPSLQLAHLSAFPLSSLSPKPQHCLAWADWMIQTM